MPDQIQGFHSGSCPWRIRSPDRARSGRFWIWLSPAMTGCPASAGSTNTPTGTARRVSTVRPSDVRAAHATRANHPGGGGGPGVRGEGCSAARRGSEAASALSVVSAPEGGLGVVVMEGQRPAPRDGTGPGRAGPASRRARSRTVVVDPRGGAGTRTMCRPPATPRHGPARRPRAQRRGPGRLPAARIGCVEVTTPPARSTVTANSAGFAEGSTANGTPAGWAPITPRETAVPPVTPHS